MARFEIPWTKTYVASGTEIVEAPSREEAVFRVEQKLGDLQGSMQYIPEEDTVDSIRVESEEDLEK